MLFTYRPESPLTEQLSFLTSILLHKDGSEQRQCLRTGPRTMYQARWVFEDGLDRDVVENLMFGAMDQTWTVPAWPEVCTLGAQANAGATSITVDHSLSDLRAGQSAIIYQDEYTYEVLNAITTPTGSIGFSNALVNTWPVGTEVYPLRDCIPTSKVSSSRYPTNVVEVNLALSVLDASVNLYTGVLPTGSSLSWSTMGFGTDSSVLVLSDPNAMNSTVGETFDKNLTVIDSLTGKFSNFSYWLTGRKSSQKGFVTHTRSDLWAVRVLLHSMKGKQQAFFLPIFAKDVVPNAGITIATNTLSIVNAGFTTYVNGKTPRKYLRLEFVDGTHQDNQISSCAIVNAQVETLTFLNNWTATVSLGNIARATLYEKVRMDSDDIQIMHTSLNGEAEVYFPVKAVIE